MEEEEEVKVQEANVDGTDQIADGAVRRSADALWARVAGECLKRFGGGRDGATRSGRRRIRTTEPTL